MYQHFEKLHQYEVCAKIDTNDTTFQVELSNRITAFMSHDTLLD